MRIKINGITHNIDKHNGGAITSKELTSCSVFYNHYPNVIIYKKTKQGLKAQGYPCSEYTDPIRVMKNDKFIIKYIGE